MPGRGPDDGRWAAAALRGGVALLLVLAFGCPMLATVRAAWVNEGGGGGGLMAPLSTTDPLGLDFRRWYLLGLETAKVVLTSLAVALPAGTLLGLLLARTDLRGRGALLALLAAPALVPIPIHASAWIGAIGNLGRSQFLGNSPILVGWPGAGFVHGMASLPWVIALVGLAASRVEPELEDAAAIDLPAWKVALRVTLRRSWGGIAGAALLVIVLTAGDMTVTDLLQVRTFAEETYLQFSVGEGVRGPTLAMLPLLAVLGGLAWIAAAACLRYDPARVPSARTEPRTWKLGAWRLPLSLGAWTATAVALAVPIGGLIWRAGRVGGNAALRIKPHWTPQGLLGSLARATPEIIDPLIASLAWASAAATLSVALSWALAWLARGPGPWRAVAGLAIALGLATPGPVLGMASVLAYRNLGVVYDLGWPLILVYIARTLPFTLLILWPAIRTLPRELLESAAADGLPPERQVLRVALPMTRGATALAWVIAALLCLAELSAIHWIKRPGLTLLTDHLWSLMHTGVESRLAAVILVSLALTWSAAVAVLLMGRRLLRSGPPRAD